MKMLRETVSLFLSALSASLQGNASALARSVYNLVIFYFTIDISQVATCNYTNIFLLYMFDKLPNIKILGEYVIYHGILRKGLGHMWEEVLKLWLNN